MTAPVEASPEDAPDVADVDDLALAGATDDAKDDATDEAMDEATDEAMDDATDDAVDEAPDGPGDAGPPRRPTAPAVSGPARSGPLGVAGRLVALGAVAGLGAAAVLVLPGRTPDPAPAPTALTLPVSASAAVPVCPGPQPLQAPEGGAEVAPDGPTVVRGLVAASGVLGADGTLRPGGPAAARMVPLLAGTRAAAGGADGAQAASGTAADGTAFTAAAAAGVLDEKVADARTKAAAAGPLRLDPDRAPGSSPVVAGTQATLVRTGDLRGLSAVSCGVATTSAWLVGGGTQEGRRARLLLANPAPSPAVASVRVLGPRGPVDTPQTAEVVVPSGAQVSVLLDAVAPGLDAMAVHVTTRSGRVAASLSDEYVRGLSPGGTDAVTAAAGPAARQVVAGMTISGGVGGRDLPADPTAPGAVAVRVAVPGTSEAVVKVRLLGPTGPVDLPGAVATVPAGGVVDVPVTGIAPGVYTAVVEADVPVVAAGLVGRTRPTEGNAGGDVPDVLPSDVPVADLAWAPAVRPLAGATQVAVPAVTTVRARIAFGALATATVVVVPVDAKGAALAPSTYTVEGGSTRAVDLPDGAAGAFVRTTLGRVYPALDLTVVDPAGTLVAVTPLRTGGAVVTGGTRTVVEDARTGLR